MASQKAVHDALKMASSQGAAESTANGPFVHLHVHSAFSLREGALPIKKTIDLAIADNQPAIAVTDRNNLFGALEFSQKSAVVSWRLILTMTLAREANFLRLICHSSSCLQAVKPGLPICAFWPVTRI